MPLFSQGVAQAALARTQAMPGRSNRLIHYRVLMEPIGTNVFFLAPWARRVNGAYRAVQIDRGGAVYDLDSQRAVSLYEADSDISMPSPEQLRAAGDYLPPICPNLPATAGARSAHSAAGGADLGFGFQQLRQSRRAGKIFKDALRIHAAIAGLAGRRSAGELSFRAQARTLRVLCFFDGRDAANAAHSVARGQRFRQRRIQRCHRQLRGPGQERARLGGSLLPRLRVGHVRSHAGRRDRVAARLGQGDALSGRSVIVLAGVGNQLRLLAPVSSRPIGAERDAEFLGAGAPVGTPAVCAAC